MITITLTKNEFEYILEKLKNCDRKDIYNKLWSIKFNQREKLNGFS